MGALFRRVLKLGLALTATVAAASAGCSDDDGADGWVAATSEEFAGAWGKAVCAQRVRPCCERDSFTYDGPACAEAHANYARQEIEHRASFGSTLNLKYASLCVRQIEAAAPDCGLDLTNNPLPPGLDARRPYCELLFDAPHLSVTPGEPCDEPTDCAATGAGHTECLMRSRRSTTTTCYQVAPGQEGDICDERDRYDRGEEVTPFFHHCEPAAGLYCNTENRRCAPRKPPETPCRSRFECADGSYCSGCKYDDPCTDGVCTAFRGLDEACDPAASLYCQRGMYCNAASGRCAIARRAGEPCDGAESCPGTCIEGVCDGGLFEPYRRVCTGVENFGYWNGS